MKRGFRPGSGPVAEYPTFLEGRRAFLHLLGAGIGGAALGSVLAGCEDAPSALAGLPDRGPHDAQQIIQDSAGTPDSPPWHKDHGPFLHDTAGVGDSPRGPADAGAHESKPRNLDAGAHESNPRDLDAGLDTSSGAD